MMTERLPHFDLSDATPEQKAVLDEIQSGPRGNLNGPFLGWIHSPELAQQAQRLGAFCRYRTGLPLRLSELAILVTAARWQAQAEWHIHYPIALEAGVAEADAEAIRQGTAPGLRGRRRRADPRLRQRAVRHEARVGHAVYEGGRPVRASGGDQPGRPARLLRAGGNDAERVRDAGSGAGELAVC
jgi:alkylhydroperoxidase family enzyme